MNTYKRHRFPPDIISYSVWLYYRFNLSHRGYGDTFFIDEVFVKINGKQHYLWGVVDQDGEVVDVYLQAKRDGAAARRFFKRLLRSHGSEPRKLVTDKLRSYGVAHRELMPESTQQYENNRAEQSHEATRVRERGKVKKPQLLNEDQTPIERRVAMNYTLFTMEDYYEKPICLGRYTGYKS